MRLEAALEEIRRSVPGVICVYLFGSRARADSNPESDVDLAFLAPSALDPAARFDLQGRLEQTLHCSVDLVDLRSASAVLRVQVLASSELLLDADPRAREAFEAFALADYARLNEERAGILEDVRRTGRVHG